MNVPTSSSRVAIPSRSCACGACESGPLRAATERAFIDLRMEGESSSLKRVVMSARTGRRCQGRARPKIPVCWALLRRASVVTCLGVEGKDRSVSEILACEKQAQELALAAPQLTRSIFLQALLLPLRREKDPSFP